MNEIAVGLGATMQVGSDSYPYTVIEIKSPARIVIQMDTYRLVEGSRVSEHQEYEYLKNPLGEKLVVSRRKDGRWRVSGTNALITFGVRRAYLDPSF